MGRPTQEIAMLRLRLHGADEVWRDVARRLRGASLDLSSPESPCDAVIVATAEPDPVERLLAAGTRVLIADDSFLTPERLARCLADDRGPRPAILNRDRFLPS